MFKRDEYELLDFGDGRRLERFGEIVADRPCPAADACSRGMPDVWNRADIRYERSAEGSGHWKRLRQGPDHWTVRHQAIRFELRPTPLGQLGIFPEQAGNWDWIEARIRRAGRTLRVLNLFAYTGGATLAAAAAGAEVVHVDASKPVVAWARRNAAQSNLAAAPIRWIVEDAQRFVERETRRGRRYEAVILDPPSYGHGPQGTAWKIERDLDSLLSRCAEVLAEPPAFVLLTCHTPALGPSRLKRVLASSLAAGDERSVRVQPLFLPTADGRQLPSGLAATWTE
ncbi:MAG: class I SAM-dependent methyltransferase [Pirellulaceae bacterium]|nr:class I SAM-dependent methyltransferase [Pirellulaceae bacterium]